MILSRSTAVALRITLLLLSAGVAFYAFLGVWMTAEFSFFANDEDALHRSSVRIYEWLAALALAVCFAVWQAVHLYRGWRRVSLEFKFEPQH